MKQGTRVYRKSAPYMGVGTVISKREELAKRRLYKREELVQVRWDMKGIIRVHPLSALQPSGVPMQ